MQTALVEISFTARFIERLTKRICIHEGKKMQDKTLIVALLLSASLILSFVAPSFAFYHMGTGIEDNKFENFGPRIDRILIKMYGSLDAEIAALRPVKSISRIGL